MVLILGCVSTAALAASIAFLVLWLHSKNINAALESQRTASQAECEGRLAAAGREQERLARDNARLSTWQQVEDAHVVADRIQSEARGILQSAQSAYGKAQADADIARKGIVAEAKASAAQLITEARAALTNATNDRARIIREAERQAETIAGKAYEAVRDAERYEAIVSAMRNTIEGYGTRYLIPAENLLDELADEFGHKEAGQQLKLARERTKSMSDSGTAARCDYVEASCRLGAERFVLDAFNGKVDSILSRTRHDNFGTLQQEIVDAYALVNFGGKPFRDARILPEYLDARQQELRWAVVAQELKRQDQEEQRRIRDQMREEARAQKEYEKAIREAAREEEALRKAMAKAQSQIESATEAQRAKYESQLTELQSRLTEAEARNQRAISMAQQTRRGFVYVISNVGSFGDHIYKIGLTRRLEPLERVWELGDASVPFDFDIHAMILSEDAPNLETRLHKHFLLNQVNKVNHRKEFFRAAIADIRRELDSLGIEAKWTMAAEAREYRETLAIERAISESEEAKDAWINRQLTLDPVDYVELAEASPA